jgi:hypothetical protein
MLFFQESHSFLLRAQRASYCLIYMSMELGYFISPVKSQLLPVQRIVHLGFGIDESSSSFFLPEKIRRRFSVLWNRLLATKVATLHDIQSFIGECNHLKLVFPASLLFTRACRLLIPTLTETAVPLPKVALDEISFWTFVDLFSQPLPWRLHQHLSLRLSRMLLALPGGQRFPCLQAL